LIFRCMLAFKKPLKSFWPPRRQEHQEKHNQNLVFMF